MARIFIGSSSSYVIKNDDGTVNANETNDSAPFVTIIQAITNCGHVAIPWYDNLRVIKPGVSLLQNLVDIAKTCDGAVFILGRDEPKRAKSKKQGIYLPNSNVLLEMGMFYAIQGISRTCHLVDDNYKDRIELPSDISGYIYTPLSADVQHLTEKFQQHFNSNDLPLAQLTTTYVEESLISKIIEKDCLAKWETKSLYIGTESCRLWRDIERHPAYTVNNTFVKDFFSLLKGNNVFESLHNVISLGSGHGYVDGILMREVKRKNKSIRYIPIDINIQLAVNSAVAIRSNGIHVPCIIIDDFEENIEHISQILKNDSSVCTKNNLFSMLGVTFSNLEKTEAGLFTKIDGWLGMDDYVLIDAIIKNMTPPEESIKEMKKKLFSKDSEYPSYLYLLINAVKKKILYSNNPSLIYEIDEVDIKEHPEKYFDVSIVSGDGMENYSHIANTLVIKCKFVFKEMRFTIFIAKEYDYSALLATMKEYFFVVKSVNGLRSGLSVNRGLFLLKKRVTAAKER